MHRERSGCSNLKHIICLHQKGGKLHRDGGVQKPFETRLQKQQSAETASRQVGRCSVWVAALYVYNIYNVYTAARRTTARRAEGVAAATNNLKRQPNED